MTTTALPRAPEKVMGPQRAAAIVPTPLSFPRTAMRELVRGRWQVRKLRFDLDAEGRGEVLYQLEGDGWLFHFFLISQKLDEAQKTDRNFAASWDAMGVLCQGEWTPEREAWLRREVPKQRAGFADYDTLMYARGNRSARVFDHVVDSLARGEQPDLRVVAPVGYVLRTTAFIGNGQLGTRAFAGFEPGHPLRRPYHAQFCSGFMLREYVFDLVDHLARARNPQAARLAPAWRRYLGLGNSAATGLTAFAANHPHLMHRWTVANEAALAQARHVAARPRDPVVQRFAQLLDKAVRHFEEGTRDSDGVFLPPQALAGELARARVLVQEFLGSGTVGGQPVDLPFAEICSRAEAELSAEAVEVLQAIALEAQPHIVDRFDDAFLARETLCVQPAMTAGELAAIVDAQYRWALEATQAPGAGHYFWYRCASAPRDVRRGLRGPAPELQHETNLDTPLQVRRLREYLGTLPAHTPVAEVTCARPDLRHVVARVQSLAGLAYAELHQDYLDAQFSPFATIRFPLSFFGMEKLEAAPPKSVRGVFLQGAPIAEDVAAGRDGDWPFPLIPDASGAADELAALPPAGLGAVERRLAASEPPRLRLAPAELARMVQVAVQGHGASLGVAEEAGWLALMAQCDEEPAVATVLAHCAHHIDRTRGARDLRDAAAGDPAFPVLRAAGASALLAAPAAADLALAHAARKAGACLVTGARDGWIVQGAVLRVAGEGRVGLLCWHACDGAGGRSSGWALALPTAAGPSLLQVRLPAPAAVHLAALRDRTASAAGSAAGNWVDDMVRLLAPASAPALVQQEAEGFLLLAVPAPAVVDVEALTAALRRAGLQVRCCSAAEREERERRWQQQGIELDAEEFRALERAGRALLVPQAEEQRILPRGFDPLKGF